MTLVPPGPPRLLALAQLANSVGDGAFYACSVLFFTRVVGFSATQVGLALTVAWGLGMLVGVPAGHLADRWGARRATVTLAVGTAATLCAFLVVRSYPLFVVAACAYACGQGGLSATRQALLAGLVPADLRATVRAQVQVALNAGLALGAGVGGLALAVDTPAAYLAVFTVDAVGFLAAALVLRRLPEVAPGPAAAPGAPRLAVLRDRPYALLALLNGVLYLNMPLLSLGLPLWIATRTDAPVLMAAVLLAVNMCTVVLFQVRVARRIVGLRDAARMSGRAGWLLLAACLVYAVSGQRIGAAAAVAVLLAAALVQVWGEMVHGAAAWTLGFGLAPPGAQGQYQGFYGMAPQLARTLGPILLTSLLLGAGAVGWLVLGGLFLVAGLAVGPVARRAARARGLFGESRPTGQPDVSAATVDVPTVGACASRSSRNAPVVR